jgi:hypothetical protein
MVRAHNKSPRLHPHTIPLLLVARRSRSGHIDLQSEHYKYRLDNFSNDEEIKPLIRGPVKRYLTFGQLKSQVSEALNELTKARNTANLRLPLDSDLLRSVARQHRKDLERIREKASQELPDTKLIELELDIETAKESLH